MIRINLAGDAGGGSAGSPARSGRVGRNRALQRLLALGVILGAAAGRPELAHGAGGPQPEPGGSDSAGAPSAAATPGTGPATPGPGTRGPVDGAATPGHRAAQGAPGAPGQAAGSAERLRRGGSGAASSGTEPEERDILAARPGLGGIPRESRHSSLVSSAAGNSIEWS